MVRGLGRVIVVTLINFIIVMVIVAIVMSTVFSIFGYEQIKSMVQEMYAQQARQIQKQYGGKLSEEKMKELLQKVKKELWARYGLDKPLHERILSYTIRLITFNLSSFTKFPGASYPVPGNNALEITLNALVRTAILFTTATILNMIISIFLGLQAAKRPGSLFDRALAIIALISYSLPMWWTGLLLIMLFAYYWRLLPYRSLDVYTAIEHLNKMHISPIEYFFRYIGTWLYYMALPLITYILVAFGGSSYITRSMVLNVTVEDFVMVARAKGLPERQILYRHVLRAASPPIVTSIIFSLIGSLGGAIISERVFQWPGMGYVYWIALNQGDSSVLLVNTWVTTILYIGAYFVLDFIYMLLDPRVRVGKGVE